MSLTSSWGSFPGGLSQKMMLAATWIKTYVWIFFNFAPHQKALTGPSEEHSKPAEKLLPTQPKNFKTPTEKSQNPNREILKPRPGKLKIFRDTTKLLPTEGKTFKTAKKGRTRRKKNLTDPTENIQKPTKQNELGLRVFGNERFLRMTPGKRPPRSV